MSWGATVLAAGGGRRFGPDGKLGVAVRGRPILRWSVDAALASGAGAVAVVLGARAVDLRAVLPDGVAVVVNDRWEAGITTSLWAAVAWAEATDLDAIVVGLGDQPFVGAPAWRRVAAADGPIAVATYGGTRANPVRLARSAWPLLPRSGDEGARALMRHRPDLVEEVPCSGDPVDVDTPEDLARWS